MTSIRVVAVDLGATSGRVMAGEVGPEHLSLRQAHRFPNGPVQVAHPSGSTLHWDILGIYREMLAGLRKAAAGGQVDGVGIDSWAVDFGLLDETGALLGNPVSYRDARTDGIREQVLATLSPAELYGVTGIQQLPFNTIYQLVAMRGSRQLGAAETLLLIPDLLGYWLTGNLGVEATNASTTQLYDVTARSWARDLAQRVGIPVHLLPPLREAGDVVGPVLPAVAHELGLHRSPPVVAVGSHDTASAVVGVPAAEEGGFAYISSGTWSLVGVELDRPVLGDAAMAADFTNEGGVDGTIRFLRNVMGLWVLNETVRGWSARGRDTALPRLLAAASDAPALRSVFDIDDPVFLAPGDMEPRIAQACRRADVAPPEGEAAVTRAILESLALAYRRNIRLAAELSGRLVDVVHVVGGGAQNALLCQLTADACGLPVLAGPVEAAALGNVLVQARTLGAPLPDLAAMRALVRSTFELVRYEPSGSPAAWDAAESRVHAVPVRTG